MKIPLYFPKKNTIEEIDEENVYDDMYYYLAMLPTYEQLSAYPNIDELLKIDLNFDLEFTTSSSISNIANQNLTSNLSKERQIKNLIGKLRIFISKLKYKIPLFDYSTKNIVLIASDDVYQAVTYQNYRFPNSKIIELLNKTMSDLMALTADAEWIKIYIKKINKNLGFLSNFDIKVLKSTYSEAFLNTNPTSREITSCIKPSYLPYQKTYQSPYYTKSELISMALNLNLIKDKKIKPWAYSKSDIADICKKLSFYEINTQMLIFNQLYILYNNAKSYVQYYSLFGSYYMNSYLRNKSSIRDLELETHIDNFLKLIQNTPAFDNEYEVYRFIENDDYLKMLTIGDIFVEDSFISTTRNPFYSMKDNVFGFILVKIRLKPNIKGIALLMESYSNYPHEQEVLLVPSRLKLVEINNDFKYYHLNKPAEKKIIKKYVFEYIEPISYDIQTYTNAYVDVKQEIPLIDFYKIEYQGNTPNERTLHFFNQLPKINYRRVFETIIGEGTNEKKYTFHAYWLTQNKVYAKFFFLQREDEQNKAYGDEIYLSLQNPVNGQIELLIEIRNIISVNYYHRFSGLSNTIPESNLLHWLAGLGKSLGISSIIIHGNYSSYANIVENILHKSDVSNKNLLVDFETMQHIDNPDVNMLNLYTSDINTYCIDVIDYILSGKKHYPSFQYVEKKVPYHMIDKLRTYKFSDMYKDFGQTITYFEATNQTDNFDQLYRIYTKLPPESIDICVSDFYKIIHFSYPYLIPKLQNLITLSYPKLSVNPWHFYYIFKPYEYLFDEGIIKFIPMTNSDKIEQMIKNLSAEVKFIHENKFRQI